ncbi:MAG: hypothetical protein LBT00_13915 [Spirochaetaceae bacterium]|jgi:hypothetical protein|nr:hypothetical protein [Spirochaetaceae bacterium]
MKRMTEEEADALDELWTKTTPKIDMSRPGYYSTHMAHTEANNFATVWLHDSGGNFGQTASGTNGGYAKS